MAIKPIELGCPGHFIAVAHCHWRRHTQVGRYRVSSVGEYHPTGGEERHTIGAGEKSFFETLVFRTLAEPAKESEGCGCRSVADWSEMDGQRYATAGEAQAGHERYVAKYTRLARKK